MQHLSFVFSIEQFYINLHIFIQHNYLKCFFATNFTFHLYALFAGLQVSVIHQ